MSGLSSKPEQAFWRFLRPRMAGHWLVTRHEDRGISPGVPDLHYGFLPDRDGEYRIGWLELKAIDGPLTAQHPIGVEPSQHQYIRTWRSATPIHFLIKVDTEILLVPGEHHMKIPKARHAGEVRGIAIACFNSWMDIGALLPPVLRDITRVK